MNTKKRPYNFTVDDDQLNKARKVVDVPELLRNAIDKVLKTRVCPCCGSEIKGAKQK